jgi:hypothetical protein
MKDGEIKSVNAMIKHWPSGGPEEEVVMDILRMVNLQYIREIRNPFETLYRRRFH